MKYGFACFRLVLAVSLSIVFSFPLTSHSAWEQIDIPGYTSSLDVIWGSSDSDIYAIGFSGHVFHKAEGDFTDITASVFGDKAISVTLNPANNPDDYPYTCMPLGLGGTSANNVYICGMTVKTSYHIPENNVEWAPTFYEATPFLYRYDGTIWTEITLDPGSLDTKFYPQVFGGFCGTSAENMYFSGWKVIRTLIPPAEDGGDAQEEYEYKNTGVVLRCNTLTAEWVGEVGQGDLVNEAYPDQLPEINGITMAGNDQIFAVGLHGLIVHKVISTNTWDVMDTESSSLNFLRVWADSPDNVFAAGFNNSNSAAVIYRYSDNVWTPMVIPTLKQGQVPSLWGIWGESPNKIHAVGNAGVSLYYDGNSGNQWYNMLSGTTTSLNSVWGASFDQAYACGEDGNVYHYTEGIVTSGIGAYPIFSVAPSIVEFTDIAPGEVVKWDWTFNDTVHDPVAPTADLDYAILVTGIEGALLNGYRISVINDDNTLQPYLVTVDAMAAQADLSGKMLVSAIPGKEANTTTLTVQETLTDSEPAIYQYKTMINVKVIPGVTTQAQVASLLESMDLIASAIPDSPDEPWFAASGSSVSYATLQGGQNTTIKVMIDSGYTTHQEIADILCTHDWITSAVADTPEATWIRGREQVSNVAEFSGGLDDSNHYVNSDKTIENYYMASHTYTKPGTYEAELIITRPVLPPVGNIVVLEENLPEGLAYNEVMFIAASPGLSMNKFKVIIQDGGDGYTPSIEWTDTSLTAIIDSGTTLQSEVADLLIKHHHILAAIPNYGAEPWYVSGDASDSTVLYGGLNASEEHSLITVQVLDENPLDFTVTPSDGVDTMHCVFTVKPADSIKGKIQTFTWYFDYKSIYDYGSVNDGSIKITTDPFELITYNYMNIGSYNVRLKVLLDDNSPFTIHKNNALIVRSPDEGQSSLSGGSGLDNVSGCFIGTLDQGIH
ncbi:MAG: hypothetical protein KKD44_22095 [Proteobacteria bacterium]|nr:hypothetical protein [Pseudomonadota bacterium]